MITETWDIANFPAMSFTQGTLICPGVDNAPLVLDPSFPPLLCAVSTAPTIVPGRTINNGSEILGIQATLDRAANGYSGPDFGTGLVNTVTNRELDTNWAGPTSGTFHEELTHVDGTWDGVFEGKRSAGTACPPDMPCWTDDLKLVGCGTSGEVQGMGFRATMHIDELLTSFTATINVQISDP